MEPLNKLTLNNKIVDMRHSVRQSRIQAINKLVKEIKKLRARKGTDEQKIKNSNKAERYVELIQIMKKVKDDDVSKFALINEKSLPQICNDINEIPEIKAIARISNHRPVFEKVKAFREKYPEWKVSLPLLFETLGEKHLNKKKKPKSLVDSGQKKVKTENIKQDRKSSSNVTHVHSTSGIWTVEDVPNSKINGRSEELAENNEIQTEINSSMNKRRYEKPPKDNDKIKNINQSQNSEKSNCDTDTELGEKDETLVNDTVSPIVDSSGEDSEDYGNQDYEAKVEDSPAEKVTKTVDPFFVTRDNKEYLSVSVINRTSSNEEKKPDFVKKKFEETSPKPKSFEKRSNSKPFKKNWQQSDVRIPVQREYPVIAKEEKPLHPSWEAKRRQTNITPFQGKKIKFND